MAIMLRDCNQWRDEKLIEAKQLCIELFELFGFMVKVWECETLRQLWGYEPNLKYKTN